jgi:hypothetical protein
MRPPFQRIRRFFWFHINHRNTNPHVASCRKGIDSTNNQRAGRKRLFFRDKTPKAAPSN